jgi:nucleotide-binding universal stress UspA family protein
MPVQHSGIQPRIVAGADGSPSSVSALRWAIRQAGLTGAPVNSDFDFQDIAEKTVTDAVSSALGPVSDVRVRTQVVEGNPAQVLLDAAAGAELLVVGSRGHGGFAEALLGSVSQHCVQHALCPVVVIRGQEAG